MSGTTRPPEVDDGGPGSLAAVLLDSLAFSRDRLRSTLLVLAPMLVVLAIFETFRLPNPAIACFLTLLMARGDAVSTMSSSIGIALMLSLSTLVATVVLAASLSQPALRVPLMALMTFATMLLVRATTLGPLVFILGFFSTYATTQADNITGIALSTGQATNTVGTGLPQIDFMPPEEALLHSVLWLSAAAAIPAVLTWITQRLFGTDPRRLLLDKLRARWTAIAAFARGAPGAADRLRALAREGQDPLLELVGLSERAHGTGALHDANVRLTRGLYRLLLLLVAWDMAGADPGNPDDGRFLAAVGDHAAAFERRTHHDRPGDGAEPPLPADGLEAGVGGALLPLALEIRAVLALLRDADRERSAALATKPRGAASRPSKPFWQPDPFAAANIRFALKVTLTVMSAFLIVNGLDWSAIGTAYVTCFFVALGTVGETVHKMTLRITGCLVGATLGIGSILLLMPSMTTFGQLVVLYGAVAFVGIWIGFGSPRVSYAGWQLLLAFALTTLQGFGPTLDMQTARDRVVGILLGNLITTLVFRFVWPVPVGGAIRADMARAFELLSRMTVLRPEATPGELREGEATLRDGVIAATAHAGTLMPNDRFEPRRREGGAGRIGRAELVGLARLVVPVSVIATDGLAPEQRAELPEPWREAVRGYHRALGDWFDRAAAWLRTGEGRERLRATLPPPPAPPDGIGALSPDLRRRVEGRTALYALTERMARDFLDRALPAPAAADPLEPEAALATG